MTSTRSLFATCSAALALLAGPALAQDDVDIFGTSVPPNVMVHLDNSGSMGSIVWHSDFDWNQFYDFGGDSNRDGLAGDPWTSPSFLNCNTGINNLPMVPVIASSTGFCPGSGEVGNICPDSSGAYLQGGDKVRCTALPGGCASAPAGWACSSSAGKQTLTLPDYTPSSKKTRYSYNYLHWVISQIYTTGGGVAIPATDRLETAKTVLSTLIDLINPIGFNEQVHWCLSDFKSSDNGAIIDAPCASGNRNAVLSKLTNLQPITNTPLAESMVDIIQYMSGNKRAGNCAGVSNISNSNPMDEWCRKNFVIMLTDGRSTYDTFSDMAGGTSNFICSIGNYDADLNEQDETSAFPVLCPTPTYCPWAGRTDAPPYTNAGNASTSGTDWLDDVTAYAYNTDLRTDLPNTQNVITYTIGFFEDNPLLREAAEKSTGKYYVATSATELADHLRNAVLEIIERSTSYSAATVPSSRTAFADGMFVASFVPRVNSGFWEGHLEAYRIQPDLTVVDVNNNPAIDATGTFVEPKHYFWDSATALLGQGARTLYTNVAGTAQDFTAASTTYSTFGILAGNPSPEWNTYPYLLTGPTKSDETVADDLVNYLHGADAFDEDRDGDNTELRAYILGDLFHSNPIVIGPPPFSLNYEDGYGPIGTAGTFLETYKHRDRRLFVGGNDGILHAFDTGSFQTGNNPLTPETESDYYDLGTGEEVFGWVPGSLLSTVKYIPRNKPRTYYYVDGSPSAADVWLPSSAVDTTKDASEWTTLLVEGMRQGGRTYIALDITDPSATAPGVHGPYPLFKWEFNDSSQPMGQTWSDPIITRIKMKATSGTGDLCGVVNGDGDCLERWVVIVSGGYDKVGDPTLATYVGDPASASWNEYGKALFVLDAQTGAVLARLNRNAADTQLQYMKFAVPSTPAVFDLDFDGFADVIYVGDTGGQVWKWVIHQVAEDTDSDGLIDTWSYGRFFDAGHITLTSGTEHYRSFFAPPSGAYVGENLVLVFGTGERTNLSYAGDPLTDDNNRLHVITDPHPMDSSAIPASPYTAANLTDITSASSDSTQTDMGYYIKAAEGEKFVTSHAIIGGTLITASYVPPAVTDPVCEQSGHAFAWVADLEFGAGQQTSSNADAFARRLQAAVGVPTDPRITISPQTGDVQLFLKGSSGQMLSLDAPSIASDPVNLIYWRQRF